MKTLIIFTLFLIPNIIIGQNIEIINNGIINRIYQEKNNIEIAQSHQTKIFPLEKYFKNYAQVLIKNSKGTYIIIDGTGRVYKANSKKQDTILFQRIDSTHFYGYNGAAIIFSNHDTLYSFGGDGYWMKNGHLRFYSEKYNEWDILPLNKEIPVTNILNYFDSKNEEIYYLQIPYKKNAINQIDGEFAIYKLNLKTKTNTRLGGLNKFFQGYFPLPANFMYIKISSLNSILVNFNSSNQYLINIKNNKTYKLKSTVIQKVFFGNSNDIQITNAYEQKNWLYYTRSNDASMQLDSVRITIDDFTPLNTEFYIPENRNQLAYGSGILAFFSIGGIFYLVKRNRQKILAAKDKDINGTSDIENFKPIELDLILKIYNKSLEGKSYSVEDINIALGLSKKSLEIQKKIRTETLNRINHRFKILFDTEDELIERIRLEEDRRFYKYIINEENGKKALGL